MSTYENLIEDTSTRLPDQILELLKVKSKLDHEYINPHFLQIVSKALSDYYDIEDEDIDAWILDMFSA